MLGLERQIYLSSFCTLRGKFDELKARLQAPVSVQQATVHGGITPTAAFYWLMGAETVHWRTELRLKFMGWPGSQLIVISHAKCDFPPPVSSC